MKRYLPHLGIVLGLGIAIYALFFSQSEEEKIQLVLAHLEDAVRVRADDTNVVIRAAHIKGTFADIFIKDVVFNIPELSNVSAGRGELVGVAAKASQRWQTAAMDLGDLAVSLDAAGMGAVAVGHAVLDATGHDGRLERDTRNVSISLVKKEGEWRIVAVTVSAKDDAS